MFSFYPLLYAVSKILDTDLVEQADSLFIGFF